MALQFQITPGVSGSALTFHLLQKDGEVLSAIEDFPDQDACLAAIHDVVEALNEDQPFAVQAAPAGSVLELRAPDGQLLAHSRPLNAGEAAALRDALTQAASEQEEYGIDLPPTLTARAQSVPAFLLADRTLSAADYDFAYPSVSGAAGFEPFQNARDGRHYFHFNDEAGEALLYSRGFGDAAQRNKRLRAVIANGTAGKRYERRTEDGRHFFVLKARNGQEIARSRAFLAIEAMEAALAWLRLEMPSHAAQFALPANARKSAGKGGGSRFNPGLTSLTGLAGFELLRNAADRRHYFLFNGEDGHPLLFSLGYKTSAGRDQGVQSLIRLGANPARYEAAEENGQHSFSVRAGNRQEIARSPVFESAAAAGAAMSLLQTRLPASAAAFGVAPEMLETASPEHLTIRRDREEAPLAAEAAVAGAALASPTVTEAMPPAPVEAAPPVTSRPSASRAGDAGWSRGLWLLPVALLAASGLGWFLHTRQSPPPVTVLTEASLQSAHLAGGTPAAAIPPAAAAPAQVRPVPVPLNVPTEIKPTKHDLVADSGQAGQERKATRSRPVSSLPSAPKKPEDLPHAHRLHHSQTIADLMRSYHGGS